MRTLGLALAMAFAAPAALAQQHTVGGSAQLTSAGPVSRGSAAPASAVAFLYRSSEHGVPDHARVVDVEFHKADLTASVAGDCSVELWLKDVPAAEDTWASGSTQTVAELEQGATRVFQGTGLALPQAMGFVRLQQTQRGLSFDHTTGNIAVLVLSACASSGPLLWKGDAVDGRGRGALLAAAASATTALAAAPPFSVHRPQTRFTWLVPGKKLQVRVGNTVIANNARFAPAMNSWAAGVAVPQHYQLWNWGLDPIALGALAFSGQSNAAASGTAPTVLMPGAVAALDVTVTPAAAGPAAFDLTLPSDDPAASPMRWGFSGVAKAAAAAQLDRRRVLPDGTTSALTDGQTVDLGEVRVGAEVLIEEDLSNYGSADEPRVAVTVAPGEGVTATVESAPATAPVQQEGRTRIKARLSSTPNEVFSRKMSVTVVTASGRLSTVEYQLSPVFPEISLQRIGEVPSGSTDALETPLPAGVKVPITYALTNTGYGLLTISGMSITGETDGTATIETPTVLTLWSLERAALTVGVTSTPGDRIAFDLHLESNDYDELSYLVKVRRDGPAPKLTVLAGDHVLTKGENHFIGEPGAEFSTVKYVRSITLRNDGDAPLTVSAISAKPRSLSTNPGPSGCTGKLNPESPPGQTLAPGETGAPFQAEVDGTQAAQAGDCGLELTVNSDDRSVDPFVATLSVRPAPTISQCGGCSTQPAALALLALLALRRRSR
ncbi:MAG: hypothetical protein IPJ65_41795 [Archangiaceae bacterium]|nr:hypothetical protein [Archangiaceae bacterium]